MRPTPNEEGAPDGRLPEPFTSTHHGDHITARFAEDAADLVVEVLRVVDAIDIMTMGALAGREYTPVEACEHTLTMHGKVRRLLGAAFVHEVAA